MSPPPNPCRSGCGRMANAGWMYCPHCHCALVKAAPKNPARPLTLPESEPPVVHADAARDHTRCLLCGEPAAYARHDGTGRCAEHKAHAWQFQPLSPTPRPATEAEYVAPVVTGSAAPLMRDVERLKAAVLTSARIDLSHLAGTCAACDGGGMESCRACAGSGRDTGRDGDDVQALADALAQVHSTCAAGPAAQYPERLLVDVRASAERLLDPHDKPAPRPLPKAVRAPMVMTRDRALDLLRDRCWDLASYLRTSAALRWLVGVNALLGGR